MVIVDEDPLEHALIEVSTDARTGCLIKLVRVHQQSARLAETSVEKVAVLALFCDDRFPSCSVRSELCLLFPHDAEIKSAAIYGVHKSLLAQVELGEITSCIRHGRVLLRKNLVNVLERKNPDSARALLAHGHGAPVRYNKSFDDVGLSGPELAAVLEALSAEAVKVVVGIALAVAASSEAERLSAVSAEDRAFQVLVMSAGLLPALVSRFADALDFGKKLLVDQRRVFTGVLDSFERDDSDVVAVLQDGVDMRKRQRRTGSLGSRK